MGMLIGYDILKQAALLIEEKCTGKV